jgi:hypothetical protein
MIDKLVADGCSVNSWLENAAENNAVDVVARYSLTVDSRASGRSAMFSAGEVVASAVFLRLPLWLLVITIVGLIVAARYTISSVEEFKREDALVPVCDPQTSI